MLTVSLQTCNKKSCGLFSWTAMVLLAPMSSGKWQTSISKYRLRSGLPTNNQGGALARWPITYQGWERRGGEFGVLPEHKKLTRAISALIKHASQQHPSLMGWNLHIHQSLPMPSWDRRNSVGREQALRYEDQGRNLSSAGYQPPLLKCKISAVIKLHHGLLGEIKWKDVDKAVDT